MYQKYQSSFTHSFVTLDRDTREKEKCFIHSFELIQKASKLNTKINNMNFAF